METALDGMVLERMIGFSQQHLLTTGGTMRFLVSNRFEMRNLNIIFRALGERLPRSEYEDMFVTEGAA